MKIPISFAALTLTAIPLLRAQTSPTTIDKLTPAEVRNTWDKLSGLITKSGGIDAAELEKARLQGILERLGKNARLVEKNASQEIVMGTHFKAEVLPRSIFYARLGDLTADHLSQLAGALRKESRTSALVLDLRSTRGAATYEAAAQLVGLFAGGGKTFFSLASSASTQKKAFTWEGDALFTGPVLVLVNEDTNGPGETAAASLRQQVHALVVGKKTPGHALEFVGLPINDTLLLEVAVGRIVLPGAAPTYLQNGVVPDLSVTTSIEQDREILHKIEKQSVAEFIFEIERPHMNEASLVAGKNPELDNFQARQNAENTSTEAPIMDRALQSAFDAATSLLVLAESSKTGG